VNSGLSTWLAVNFNARGWSVAGTMACLAASRSPLSLKPSVAGLAGASMEQMKSLAGSEQSYLLEGGSVVVSFTVKGHLEWRRKRINTADVGRTRSLLWHVSMREGGL
jgi:hypothetical protein